MLRVESGGRAVEGPAWVLPGQPERVVTLYLGYGRKRGGRIGTGIGYDAYRMRSVADAVERRRHGGGRRART